MDIQGIEANSLLCKSSQTLLLHIFIFPSEAVVGKVRNDMETFFFLLATLELPSGRPTDRFNDLCHSNKPRGEILRLQWILHICDIFHSLQRVAKLTGHSQFSNLFHAKDGYSVTVLSSYYLLKTELLNIMLYESKTWIWSESLTAGDNWLKLKN